MPPVTPSLFTTPLTPGTSRTAASIPSLSSALRTAPCSVTTKEQELTLSRGVPGERLPRAPRTSWTSRASFAGAPSSKVSRPTLPLRTKLGHEGEAAVAHPAFVQGFLELGLSGELDCTGRGGLDQGDEVPSLGRGETRRTEVRLLPLEEPHAPGEGDENAARLGAGDLALPP